MKITQNDIKELKEIQEQLEQESIKIFNDKKNTPEEIEKGRELYNTSRKLLHRIGDLQEEVNRSK